MQTILQILGKLLKYLKILNRTTANSKGTKLEPLFGAIFRNLPLPVLAASIVYVDFSASDARDSACC